MIKTTGAAPRSWYSAKRLWIILSAFILILVLGVFAFLRFYNSYIDQMLYYERLAQMREVTAQLFTSLDNVVETQWEGADTQRRYLESTNPKTEEMLIRFMEHQAVLNQMDESKVEMLVVDSEGHYYTQAGLQGMLANMDYLLDEPERVNYVFKSLTTNQTQMCFLIHLQNPVVIYRNGKSILINYCGIARDMEELTPYFSCSAYNSSNSVYITDKYGARLFTSNTDANPLHGYNVYNALNSMEYLHNSSFDATLEELNKNGIAYSNAVLDGREYFYSLYTMKNAEWNLLFLVPSEYVAINTTVLVNTTVRLIMIFASAVILISSAMIFYILRTKQRQELAAERSVNETLSEMNEQLTAAVKSAESASRAKSDFLANMSHDIRTPMNAIVGITNLMEHEPGLSTRMESYVHKVQTSSHHLLGLINDILDMSKIESNEVALNTESVSLAEQIGHVDNIIRPQTNERDQTFTIHVDQVEHEYLICDGVRLRQIFLNLLSNAVKYTQRGGNISFDIAELPCDAEGKARFSFVVKDNGQGMSPEFVTHIFEAFTREESSGTNKIQGTGLGMAITKSIVDIMGGKITVDSTPGMGSRFEVTLDIPINTHIDYHVEVSDILLLFGDDRLERNIRAALRLSSVKITRVQNVDEAAELLKQRTFDMLLLADHIHDDHLADIIRTLRSASARNAGHSDALLIFCVDYTDHDSVRSILDSCGANGLISRPFFMANMVSALDHVYTSTASESSDASVLNG